MNPNRLWQAAISVVIGILGLSALLQSINQILLRKQIEQTNAKLMSMTELSFNSSELPKQIGFCMYRNGIVISSGSNYIAVDFTVSSGGNIGWNGVILNLTNHYNLDSPFTNAAIEIGPWTDPPIGLTL